MADRKSIINPQIHVKNVHAESASAGAAVTITIPADAENFWAVGRVDWSWSASNGGDITISYNGTPVWKHHDATHGHGYAKFTFPDFLHNNYTLNEELTVTISGVGSATGRLTVRYC